MLRQQRTVRSRPSKICSGVRARFNRGERLTSLLKVIRKGQSHVKALVDIVEDPRSGPNSDLLKPKTAQAL